MLHQQLKKEEAKPEHIQIALQFSSEMLERFNPTEINELFQTIKDNFIGHREREIEDAQKKLAYLQESIHSL